nr:hypothetical protein CFP56_16232 [Quercus suber]
MFFLVSLPLGGGVVQGTTYWKVIRGQRSGSITITTAVYMHAGTDDGREIPSPVAVATYQWRYVESTMTSDYLDAIPIPIPSTSPKSGAEKGLTVLRASSDGC